MTGRIAKRVAIAAALVALVATTGWVVVLQGRLSDARGLVSSLRDRLETAREVIRIAETSAERDRNHATELTQRLRRKLHGLATANGHLVDELDDASCFDGYHGRERFVHGPVRGDLDGDGVRDEVYTTGLPALSGGCRYSIVVRTASGVQRLGVGGDETELRYAFRPFTLVDLNRVPGQEVAVEVNYGAYAQIVRLYTIVAGRLERIRGFGERNLWVEGSSSGVGVAVDCVGPPGRLIWSEYEYAHDPSRYRLTRRFYTLSSTTAMKLAVERHLMRWDALERFPEFNKDIAFVHCPNGTRHHEYGR